MPAVPTDPATLRAWRARAETLLHANVWTLPGQPEPVLTCGQGYPGIWLEHNQDNVFYLRYDPAVARAGHDIFIRHQAADGLLPPFIRRPKPPRDAAEIGDGHVQSVLPFARSALAVARGCRDEAFLARAYAACVRYDAWLMRFRNRRGTGLIEMFCEWDTGHDHSPRVTDGGIEQACPGLDARICPPNPALPIIAADLSAMLYGARLALAEMADALGRGGEAASWRERAAETQARIDALLWDPEDEFYYDLAPDGRFRRYRSEHITRLFLNQVVDQSRFDRIWTRHFTSPDGFATPYPFPSMALSDPSHQRGRRNCWGGPSQALTMLRAVMWMEPYGRKTELDRALAIWLAAIMGSDQDHGQELDPLTGQFSNCAPRYTPTLLLAILAIDRALQEC